ncbi:hypothetical protein CDIK_0300 [Cucumispora dikerogammari]|nr:hypothetical protein CDIK_0300 [Cucumispora dikerogammari]
MIKISTPKKSTVLRKKTNLKPVTKNSTRWFRIFDMFERFIKIWEFIDVEDPDLAKLMPSHLQLIELQNLLVELKLLNGVNIFLQKEEITLLDVRNFFDKFIAKHSTMATVFKPDATIIQSKHFDSVIIKVLAASEEFLRDIEKGSIRSLLKEASICDSVPVELHNLYIDVSSIFYPNSKYIDFHIISPTSNVVERLFSLAGQIYSNRRQSMETKHLKQLFF